MPNHALVFVNWKVFRRQTQRGRPERSFYYASPNPRLVERVGDGGTLWAVTRKPSKDHYSLAFRLAACRQRVDIPDYIIEAFGSKTKDESTYMVVSEDWDACDHYPYNNAAHVLGRLEFTTGKSFRDCKERGRGLKLLTVPQLEAESAILLQAFAHRLLSKRSVFLSYAHEDRGVAYKLVRALKTRGIAIQRDVNQIRAGDRWATKLEEAVKAADIFVILASKQSARSKWVRREIEWAKQELEAGGCVRTIIPLKLPDRSWQRFPELHEFQYMAMPFAANRTSYEKLARTLAVLPRRRSAGWEE
jgi:hypothetical protein